MSDEKDSFRVSDRRKFNSDGTPREQSPDISEAPPPNQASQPRVEDEPSPQVEPPAEATATDNLLSFPGEPGRKREREPASAAPGAASAQSPSPTSSEEPPLPPGRQSANEGAAAAYDHASGSHTSHLPAASFLGLANMLGVEAAMHLGLIENGPGEDRTIDLEAAKHVIDLLGIVQEKTRGNLTHEEETLLDNMLADLRMQFVAALRRR